MPGDLKKFFFTLGGAEATENAVKIAKQYTKRWKVMTRNRAYHGATAGAINLTGDPRRWPNEPGVPGIIRTQDPYQYRSLLYEKGMTEEEFSAKLLGALEETINFENPESFAAMILETVTGTNGVLVPPKGYLQGVRDICDKYGMLMICDEVMCGVGRTGEFNAVDHWKVVPDMITIAKGLTSGYIPLGCVVVREKIAKEFDDRVLSCGLTYQAHPMGLAACTAVVKVIEEEDIVGNAKRVGKVMRSLQEEMMEKHRCVGEVRNLGLHGCIELVTNRETKEPICGYHKPPTEPLAKFITHLKEKGIFIFTNSNNVHLNPPLCVTEEQLKEAFVILDEGFSIVDKHCKL